VAEKRIVVGSVQETFLGPSQRFARQVIESAVPAMRNASSSGGRTASMGAMSMGIGGSPGGAGLPSSLASGSPLSVFQYSLSRPDRLAMFRYFARTDPFVARALELHSELPLSRLTIGPPRGPNSKQNKQINRLYESMSNRLGLLTFFLELAREYWLGGDVYIWHEWNDKIKEWDDLYILPTEYCHSVPHPFLRKKELIIFSRPLVDTASIRRMTDRDLYRIAGDPDIQGLMDELDDELPEGLKSLLDFGEGHPLNTDPRKGSFVYHLARNRPPNEPYGQGILERCLETLLRLENLKNAQLQITGRNMQPKHLIWGEGIGPGELADLRVQVDLSLLDNVDYPIVTNYPVHWETIGSQQRLLNVEAEYQLLREDLATGLCTTKEMLTGAATYGAQRITLELMNTQYLTFRELIREYVEECIFRPVAEAQGHYYFDEIDSWLRVKPADIEAGDDIIQEYDGQLRRRVVRTNKVYNHSQLRFNRLSIRDNSEVYEQLFQLHQKGSLALRYLLDIHNIDPEENAAALLEDLLTVRDPTFNRLLESVYQSLAEPLIANTDLLNRVIQGLNLDVVSQAQGEPAPGGDAGAAGGGISGGPAPPDAGEGDGSDAVVDASGMPMDAGMPGAPVDVGGPPTASRRRFRKQILAGKVLTAAQKERVVAKARKLTARGQDMTNVQVLRTIFPSKGKVKKNRAG